jgi:hypothetical protein
MKPALMAEDTDGVVVGMRRSGNFPDAKALVIRLLVEREPGIGALENTQRHRRTSVIHHLSFEDGRQITVRGERLTYSARFSGS